MDVAAMQVFQMRTAFSLALFAAAAVACSRGDTDASGRLWLVVGVDSGFEGSTSVYITSIRVAFTPR